MRLGYLLVGIILTIFSIVGFQLPLILEGTVQQAIDKLIYSPISNGTINSQSALLATQNVGITGIIQSVQAVFIATAVAGIVLAIYGSVSKRPRYKVSFDDPVEKQLRDQRDQEMVELLRKYVKKKELEKKEKVMIERDKEYDNKTFEEREYEMIRRLNAYVEKMKKEAQPESYSVKNKINK